MIQTLQSRISGKRVLILFCATNSVYFTMLGYSIPKVMVYSAPFPLFDMCPLGYSYQDALALLNQLGEEGRRVYRTVQLVIDLFYPALFGLCYFCLTQWLLKQSRLKSLFWLALSLVPIFVCVFDYAENVSIWLMLIEYPSISALLVSTSSIFTLLKSMLTVAYFSGLIVLFCVLASRKLKR